jgi:hypothetical protein
VSCIQADEDQNDGDKRWEPDSDVESDDDRYPKFALSFSFSLLVFPLLRLLTIVSFSVVQ